MGVKYRWSPSIEEEPQEFQVSPLSCRSTRVLLKIREKKKTTKRFRKITIFCMCVLEKKKTSRKKLLEAVCCAILRVIRWALLILIDLLCIVQGAVVLFLVVCMY